MYSLHHPSSQPTAPRTGTTTTIGGSTAPRILVAEDTDCFRILVAHILTAEGYMVTEARHGEAALRLTNQASVA